MIIDDAIGDDDYVDDDDDDDYNADCLFVSSRCNFVERVKRIE